MNFKNLNYLIKKDERILFLIIFLSIVFSAFLETISIAIFLPLFNIIFGGQLDDNYLIQIFNNLFYVENYEFSHLLIFIIFVFIFKNLIYLFLIYVKIKMVNIFSQRKKSSLLRAYLDQSFFIFDKRNKAELMRNIYVEVDNLIDNFILPTIEVTYTVLVLVFVSIFLFFYDAETTIIIFLSIVPIFFVFYSLTKARLLFYGAERALLHQKILKKIPNALNGFFEIKLFGISEIVNKDLMKSVRRLNKIKIPQAIIGNIPRSFLEIFVISCFSIFLIYQIDNGEDILPLIAKLSIYVIVIIKLLPFLNGIATFYSKLMRGIESYKILVIEFSKYVNIPKSDKKVFTQEIQNITFDKVSYKYINETNNKNNIFENINLEIKKNDFVGIVGPSGSGKTTFLKLITGMLEASEGKIFVNKDDIRKIDQRFFYQKISYIPQDPFFIYDDIVKNIISSNMLKEIDEDKIIKILEKVQLSQFIKNNKLANSFIGENANYLSGGEKQRLAIARAFYKESSLLIFDEITNKLDKKTSDKIMSLINSLKGDKTIIIVSHNVNNLTNTNYNLSLENNKILKIK